MGLTPFHMSELKQQVNNADFIFNTIPKLVLTAEIIAQMPQTAFILDLASKPGGLIFAMPKDGESRLCLHPDYPVSSHPKQPDRF